MWHEAWSSAYESWYSAIQGGSWRGLLILAVYILAASLCFAARQADRRSGKGGAWLLASGLLVVLGVNALYRVDILLTGLARAVARTEGWYGGRRDWQFLLLILLGVASLVILIWLRIRLQQVWSECMPAVAGLGLLCTLALLRLVSYHTTDAVINLRLVGVTAGRLLELAGLGMTLAGAMRWLHVHPHGSGPNSSAADRQSGHDASFRR